MAKQPENSKSGRLRKAAPGSRASARARRERSYRGPVFAAIHEAAERLHTAGMLNNATMRGFDRECLTPVLRLSPASIKKIREKASLSEAVFAAHLNVTTGVVSKWEREEKQPRGPAAKLLSLAAKNGIASIAIGLYEFLPNRAANHFACQVWQGAIGKYLSCPLFPPLFPPA